VFFFFFQAEDGIRDIGVTGVQTCALPISSRQLVNRGELPGIGVHLTSIEMTGYASCSSSCSSRRSTKYLSTSNTLIRPPTYSTQISVFSGRTRLYLSSR